MGMVYKAEDTRLHRFVALKFLPDDVAGDAQALNHFRREAEAASALNHPNDLHDLRRRRRRCPRLHGHGVFDGLTLKHCIGGKPMPVDELLPIAISRGVGKLGSAPSFLLVGSLNRVCRRPLASGVQLRNKRSEHAHP